MAGKMYKQTLGHWKKTVLDQRFTTKIETKQVTQKNCDCRKLLITKFHTWKHIFIWIMQERLGLQSLWKVVTESRKYVR